MKSVLDQNVLVLNSAYEAINVISVKKAITLVCKGQVEVLDTEGVISSKKWSMDLPSVIRLLSFNRVPKIPNTFSKKKIFLRDQYICQYCSETLTNKNATVDHILPVSRGGKSNWENLVTACSPCNRKKADRTPNEAMMPLKSKPKGYFQAYRHNLFKNKLRPSWNKFLYQY